uniref:Ribosomal protein L1 n=1 Tax=Phaeomonas parva TaxID=124430 RepID=A0A7S1UKI9_9STRA|mmetsp:Transcript_9804/g.28816  ORF Transcript_9804/g.28816 Transcript_9804/m.28816 type:complete len:308 (+) Transcript_9804:258-1181(+)
MPDHFLDGPLVARATAALLRHLHEEQAKQRGRALLDPEPETVLLQFALKTVPAIASQKPIRLAVPHPFLGFGEGPPRICLICKQESVNAMKELFRAHPDLHVDKVVGLSALRTEYKRYEKRRELMAEFNLFVADDRILPMLAKALGKIFFKAKKHPLPIKINQKGAKVARDVAAARDSTYLHLVQGPCLALRVGHTGMEADAITENIRAVVPAAVSRIPKKWRNILSIHLKTATSVALPVYASDRTLKAIARQTGDEEGGMDEEEAGDDAPEETPAPAPAKKAKKGAGLKPKAVRATRSTRKRAARK